MQRARRSAAARDAAERAAASARWDGKGPPAQVVRVRKDVIARCVTCLLCRKLLRDATTISECLHTFCRKCIFEKLNDEEVDYCPICNIDLGVSAIEKLRPDNNLQDIRAKIFPFKRRKVNDHEDISSFSLPARRKERSLSSLVVTTTRIASQTYLRGRRTKPVTRRASGASRGINPVDVPSQEDEVKEHSHPSSSPESLVSKSPLNRRQTLSGGEASSLMTKNDTGSGENFVDKTELWKPLNCLVEAANRTKALKSPQIPIVKTEQVNDRDSKIRIPKSKAREHSSKSKNQNENSGTTSTAPLTSKAGKLSGGARRRKELRTSAQLLIDAASNCEKRSSPVWFSLIAATNQERDKSLSQISASCLRIKNCNLPVSFIQKYLAKKLDLPSEAEVEIMCRDQPVGPTLPLHSLEDLWLCPGPSPRVTTSVGASAKEFVMVLSYRRKACCL